jgi:nucleoside-diphosphate-sugar epimerase
MRIAVLGGTRFIGRRIVADLVARGDEVLIVHRGETEPSDLPACRHVHTPRSQYATVAAEVRAFEPAAIVDTLCMSQADADAVLPHLPDAQLVLLSSMDVYQAFWHVLNSSEGEPVPLSEASPVRSIRYPYGEARGEFVGYEKLDVEPPYLERGGTVLRLAMIYGEHDNQRREEFILRRVRAARERIPIGAGTFLWTRCHVADVSTAVQATIGNPLAASEVFNVCEPTTRSVRGWADQILTAAGSPAELVTVADTRLPEDMWITRAVPQHLVFAPSRATEVLGWQPADPTRRVRESVEWHLAHPPADASADFTDDDAALAAADIEPETKGRS